MATSYVGSSRGLGGITAMLVACAMFVIGDTCLKLLGQSMALGEMLFLRGVFGAPVIVFLAARAGKLGELPQVAANPRILLRTFFEIGSTILFVAGLVRMTYADAITIQQFVPLAAMTGAAIFLGEGIGWRRWLAALVGFVGVLIVVRPTGGSINWPALLIIGNVAFIAGRDLVTRRIGFSVPSVLVALMSIVCVGLSGLLLLPFETWRIPSAVELGLIAIAGFSSVGGFYWVTEALRRGEVASVIPFRYSLIPYGVLAGIVVFGEWPDRTTLIGIAIVLGAGLYAMHRERIRTLEALRQAKSRTQADAA